MSLLATAITYFATGKGKTVALLAGALLVVLLCGLAAWRGYAAGYDRADAARRAEVAELRSEHQAELAERWRVVAAAEREARERWQARSELADRLSGELAAERRARQSETRRLRKEITRYAHNADRRLSADFVRLYNQAIRAPSAHDLPGAEDSAGAAGAAGAAPAADIGKLDAGKLAGASAVTEADLLANAEANGARCEALAARLNALIDLVEGWRATATGEAR
jgi:hypothetical protein